jgi:hypothetical protein
MDYALLHDEIGQPAYAGMTDAEIVTAINATSTDRRRVSIAALQARAMEVSAYVALRTAVLTPETPAQLRALAQSVLDLVSSRFEDIDLDNQASRQMFGALQQAGVISAQQAAAIDALATVEVPSRAGALSLGTVTADDIQAARDWYAAQVAEGGRLVAFGLLRERLVVGYNVALIWLQAQQDAGHAAPEWATLIERM